MARFIMERGDGIIQHGNGMPRASRERPTVFDLNLHAPADASALAVARHSVGATAGALGFDAARLADIRLALTEAMTAAIRRAGPDEMLDVTVALNHGVLRVAVRDRGGALPINDDLPLPLVAALTDAVEVTHLDGGGTEVAMTFGLFRR